MGEELTEVQTSPDDSPASTEAGAPAGEPGTGAVSGEVTLESLSPEIRAVVEAEVKAAQEAVRTEFEQEHIPTLKSQRDKLKNRLKEVERREREQALVRHEQTRQLVESDPEKAAALAIEQNEQLLGQQQAANETEAVGDWVSALMGDMGYDLEDEEVVALAESQTLKIVGGLAQQQPVNYTYEVQQELARGLSKQKDDQIAARDKELKALKDSMPTMVRDEVTRALAGTNTPDGSVPGAAAKQEEWRQKPAGQKRRDGLATRRANPVKEVRTRQK